MSADNYLYVRKLDNGKFDVTHRFASTYYSDEIDYNSVPEDWIEDVPPAGVQYDTLAEAVLAAHSKVANDYEVVEYGVCVQPSLLRPEAT